MSTSKFLSDSGWKDIAAKNSVKDNGLLKKLADYKRVGDDKHDEALKVLDEVIKLAEQLKKDKKTAPAAGKYLDEVADAAKTEARDVTKAKAEADKAAKAKAEADKKAQAEAAKKGEGDGDDDEDPSGLLTTKLKPLLRQVAKGETMHALLAKSGKKVMVLLSRKPIPAARRKMLADELGGGSTKYYPGHCELEAGATTFVLKAEVAGMSKLIKAALLEQTGLRINKIKCRGEDGDDDDGEGEGDAALGAELADQGDEAAAQGESPPDGPRPFAMSASVGQGGKNLEEDVKAVQAALNRRADAGLAEDGNCGRDTIEAIIEFQRALGQTNPDGRVEPKRGTARALAASGKVGKPPPPPNPMAPPEDLGKPTLERAPQVWHGTRNILDHNINELKRAIKQEYASEHPTVLDEIDRGVQRVDVILEKLDVRLAEALERAGAATDAAKRKAELASAKTIIADYIAFVKTEPLIEHIDNNPFGVDAQVRKVITDSLTHMIKSMA
jgi:hypothetical protein